jgi:hypothetical protein
MNFSRPQTFVSSIILLAIAGLLSPEQVWAQQSSGGSSDKEQNLARLAKVTNDWLNGKLSTPGITVVVREVARSNGGGHLMVQYHAFVTGAPKDQTYGLVTWPINSADPVEQMKGLSVGADGIVICAGRTPEQCGDPNKKDDPVEFTFAPVRGEIFRVALVSTDNKTKIFFAVVPDPLVNTSGTCSLEAIRVLPNFEMALIRAKGFQPNEDLAYASKSEDEKIDRKVKADGNGGYSVVDLPGVINHQNGTATVKITGTGCAPEISFKWGK